MSSYSKTFDDTHKHFNVAFRQWTSSPNPERKTRMEAAMTKWGLLLDPVIGHARAIEYRDSVFAFIDKKERHQKLIATYGLHTGGAGYAQILSAQQEETEARWRFEAADDATAKALIRAEMRDLVGSREDGIAIELQALIEAGDDETGDRSSEPLITYWRVRGPYTKSTATCAGFEVEAGLAICVVHDPDLVMSSLVFQGSDAREVMDAHAALALQDLLKKGYDEVPL